MFLTRATNFIAIALTTSLALVSAYEPTSMDQVLEPRILEHRQSSSLRAACEIYGSGAAAPGIPEYSWYIIITLTGGWPANDGLSSILKSNLGSSNVLSYSYTSPGAGSADVRFYAPGVINSNSAYWDSQISNSIKTYSGTGLSVTCQYPGI